MYSDLYLAAIIVIAVVIFGYFFLLSKYCQSHPTYDRSSAKNIIGLHVFQLGIWTFAFISLWAFLPTNPSRDGGLALLGSDIAQYMHEQELKQLYFQQNLFGIGWLIFGGIASYILYSVYTNKISDIPTFKKLSVVGTCFSAILSLWVGFILILALVTIIQLSYRIPNSAAYAIIILGLLALLYAVVKTCVKQQRMFNKILPTLAQGQPVKQYRNIQSETMACPYCGEQILSVAKKCKHCGEWIKPEDLPVNKIPCPICGEEIPADSTVCPICHEPITPTTMPNIKSNTSSSPSESKGETSRWLIILAALIVVVVGIVFFTSNHNSSSDLNDESESDSFAPVEIVEEASDEYNYDVIDPIDTLPTHDNTIHNLNEYNGY